MPFLPGWKPTDECRAKMSASRKVYLSTLPQRKCGVEGCEETSLFSKYCSKHRYMTRATPEVAQYKHNHYIQNIDVYKERSRLDRENNPERKKKKDKDYRANILKSWEGFLPSETYCEICEKPIFFNKKDSSKSIHFDHKTGFEPIRQNPSNWLREHRRTPETEAIWKSCNFGMLCRQCNLTLPTKNRIQFVKNINRYTMWGYK